MPARVIIPFESHFFVVTLCHIRTGYAVPDPSMSLGISRNTQKRMQDDDRAIVIISWPEVARESQSIGRRSQS